MEAFRYSHQVRYYETDMMGITHHSNYIRWMEEARGAYLESIGLPYKMIEERGIVSPVTAVNVSYKTPSTFDDEVIVETSITKFTGIRFEVEYLMTNAKTGDIVAEATSSHCFIKDGKICSLKREEPQICQQLVDALKSAE